MAAPAETRSYGWGRRVDGDDAREGDRGRRSNRRVVRPRDMQHEPPLPEDVAFRSPPEGGDRTIFPGRRRRPQGIREDERVLLAGPRSLGGWIEHNIPLQPYEAYIPRPYAVAVALGVRDPFALVTPQGVAIEPDLIPAVDPEAIAVEVEAITEAAVTQPVTQAQEGAPQAGDEEAARKRRRRGRRGGRNRRRNADGVTADDATPDIDAVVEEIADEIAGEIDQLGGIAPAVSEFDSIEAAEPLVPVTIDASVHVVAHEGTAEALGSVEPVRPLRDRVIDDELPRVTRRRSMRSPLTAVQTATEPARADVRAEAPIAKVAVEVAPAAPQQAAATPARRPQPAPVAPAAVDPSTYPQAFVALGATERTLPALASFGFQMPTPIQVQAIPALLEGRDVVGIAKTGSGKTVAFGVPMVEKLDADLGEVQGIVLVPTRELAQQVLEVLQLIAAPRGMQAIGLLGGHAIRNDLQALERRPQIVVGTPGRIIDHLQRGTLSLRTVTYAVLDEADQMLDIGFLPDIRRILSRTPKRRQTALFSATMPGSIRRLIWQFMSDPQQVAVDAESTPVDSIEQIYFEVAHRDKAAGLRELIDRELKGRTLVFCKTKRAVDMLEANLSRMGVRVGALHGDMDQRHRDHVIADFRVGALDVLVATNVAARGLDIPEITHVLNFDVPQNPEEYLHRIGRTGRAGREGKAITFVSEWDMAEFDAIRAEFGENLHEERLDLYQPRVAPRVVTPERSPEAVPAAE
ncbi:MAG: DEAD/DEAH box helicase [Dehalococcoidia bacterium]|nr:MAG: DEAD/DEAH box helicase [Dehalococcoidia bacterium]